MSLGTGNPPHDPVFFQKHHIPALTGQRMPRGQSRRTRSDN